MAGKKENIEGRGGTSPAASKSGPPAAAPNRKKGLAPFASLEDLSDDSPPDDKARLTLPGIREDPSPSGAGGQRPSITTPRIDISRASSSSHHDDSSPERELFAGAEGSAGGSTKIGLGFTEEMAQELRNSTEELDFQDPEEETKSRRKKLHHQQQAVTKYELDAQSEKESRERKDSTCSEGGLLLIGGRTSRLSSIGSVASGGSVASHISIGSAISGHSHLSAASYKSGRSHLSAASDMSRASRCSSPHRMLLETSFCGPKPIPTLSLEAEYPPSESVEATLLARKTDITGAVLPPDEVMKASKPFSGAKSALELRSGSTKSHTLDVKTNKAARSHSERIAKISGPAVVAARSSSARSHAKRTKKKQDENALVRIIPLHGSLDDSDDTLGPDDQDDLQEPSPAQAPGGATITPDGGIFIPLKGPVDDPAIRELTQSTAQSIGPRKTKATKTVSQPNPTTSPRDPVKKHGVDDSDLVRFISLHGDNDEEIRLERERKLESQRPSSRASQNVQFSSSSHSLEPQVRPKKPKTPEPKSKCKPSTLDVKNGRPAQSMTNLPRDESRTPSPAST
ncbi:unnamed protein product, partial [Nesidiocoris tenuis]